MRWLHIAHYRTSSLLILVNFILHNQFFYFYSQSLQFHSGKYTQSSIMWQNLTFTWRRYHRGMQLYVYKMQYSRFILFMIIGRLFSLLTLQILSCNCSRWFCRETLGFKEAEEFQDNYSGRKRRGTTIAISLSEMRQKSTFLIKITNEALYELRLRYE